MQVLEGQANAAVGHRPAVQQEPSPVTPPDGGCHSDGGPMSERSERIGKHSRGLRVSEVRTIAELTDLAAGAYGKKPALRFRRDGGWVDRSYTELAATVDALARGLAARGVAAGDRVCLLGETRPEWSYVGLAVVAAGAILVPIYPSSSVEECAWIVRDSGARLVVCDDAAQAAKI